MTRVANRVVKGTEDAQRMVREAHRILLRHDGDKSKAFELLLQADKLKSAEAAYALGSWYIYGFRVERDFRKAVHFLKRAMKRGSGDAAYDLAICLERGNGISKNKVEAFRCYTYAALQLLTPPSYPSMYNFEEAAAQLARCYYYGIGTPSDRKVSQLWSSLSHFHAATTGSRRVKHLGTGLVKRRGKAR